MAMMQTIKEASASTGLSMRYLREGCKNGTIAHVWSGRKILVNVEWLKNRLNQEGITENGRLD